MPPTLPEELIDQIVDYVQTDPHRGHQRADTLALLRAARCFGARCRKHLYHAVDLALEITPPTVIKKNLDVKSLRFVELVRRTPSLADLVKNVHYSLYFELHDNSYITFTPAWRILRKLAPYLTRVDLITLNFYDDREMWDRSDSDSESLQSFDHTMAEVFRMTPDSQVFEAIGLIIPSCPFSRLRIEQTSLLPVHLVGFLAHCPHVTSLEIRQVSALHDPLGGSGTLQSQIPAVPPKIEELIFNETSAFIVEMLKDDACRTLVASTRRLVFAGVDSWIFTEDIMGEFISQLVTLEKVFFRLDHGEVDMLDWGSDVRTFVHAPSLCLQTSFRSALPDLSTLLRQNLSYPSGLRSLALIVDTCEYFGANNPTIAHWRELASVLRQPRFMALETVCITFTETYWQKQPPLIEEEVSRCFADFSAKVTVKKCEELPWGPSMYTYFDTFF